MYKVLLVDDESLIREAISENMPWEEMGFTLLCACENGRQAMEQIKKEVPDLLLTDINMPFVDGMELAKYVYENYPDTKVIIISGFDEFEYAKQAVKYQVLEYILKPVTQMEFRETLQKAREVLDERRQQQKNMKKIRSAYMSSLPALQGRFLHHLLNGTVDLPAVPGKLEELHLSLAAPYYNTAFVEGDSLEPFTRMYANVRDELALFAIYNITAEIVTELACGITFQDMNERTVIIFMGSGRAALNQLVDDACGEIRKSVKGFLQIDTTIAVGKDVETLAGLPDSYGRAKAAMEYKFLLGGSQIIKSEEYEELRKASRNVDINAWAAQIASAIRMNDRLELKTQVEGFVRQLRECYINRNRSIVSAQNLVLSVLNLLEMTEELEEQLNGIERPFMNEVYTCEHLSVVKEKMLKLFEEISGKMSTQRDSYCRRQAMLAMEYIEKNFSDSGLSLNSVCSYLAMSTSYFSSIFKNYTGETFIEALTKKRMEKAKLLLEQTNKKTYEIAEQVGYSDAHYFSIAFKKMTGKTPKEYAREMKH